VLVDTHAHLDDARFDPDRDEVVRRAEAAGVTRILIPGIDAASSRKAVALAGRFGIAWAAAGIHPNSAAAVRSGDMDEIRELAENRRVIAIGETGLDFYRDRAPRDIQVALFREHLDLARTAGLPVVIHFRNAEFDAVEMAGREHFEGVRGVFHCFGGSVGFAQAVVEMGFYIGFDGPLTYPGSDRPEIARSVPLDRALLETDCPYLAPQSRRGGRNEPAFVSEIAASFARARGIDIEEAAVVTGRNAHDLFGFEELPRAIADSESPGDVG
jgi:TatD DNase family protein